MRKGRSRSHRSIELARTIAANEGATGLVAGALYELDAIEPNTLLIPLRKGLFRTADLEQLLPELSGSRTHGTPRIRRVLRLRPAHAPPTGSLMETLMVQIARRAEGVPEPDRQVVVTDGDRFVARVDLAWVPLGGFTELDGQQHEGQPEYDAARQTDVVATTGWLPGRFVWREVRYNAKATGVRLARFVDQLRRRPLPS